MIIPRYGNHGKNDNHCSDQWRKIKPEKRQRDPDENAIHHANEQLAPEIGGDVFINLRQDFRDFVFEW